MLLERYLDGLNLSKQEYKYLDLTSEELNKTVDKRHYQIRANLLDPDFIHNVEVCIADEILTNYLKARKKVISNRKKFLSLRTKKKATSNERFFKKLYETELKPAQLHKKKRVYSLIKKTINQILQDPKKLKKLQLRIKKVAKLFKEMKRDTEKINTMHGEMTINQLEHFRHPHSKIFKKRGMRKKRQSYSFTRRRNPAMDRINKEEKKFRVKSSTISKLSGKEQFIKCFSTGPLFNNAYSVTAII